MRMDAFSRTPRYYSSLSYWKTLQSSVVIPRSSTHLVFHLTLGVSRTGFIISQFVHLGKGQRGVLTLKSSVHMTLAAGSVPAHFLPPQHSAGIQTDSTHQGYQSGGAFGRLRRHIKCFSFCRLPDRSKAKCIPCLPNMTAPCCSFSLKTFLRHRHSNRGAELTEGDRRTHSVPSSCLKQNIYANMRLEGKHTSHTDPHSRAVQPGSTKYTKN